MRRSRLSATLAAAFLLVACDTPTTAPAPASVPGTRQTLLLNERNENLTFNATGCNGEILSGTANQHLLASTTYDAARGTHVSSKSQLTNIRLTGPSGVSYVGSGEQSFSYTIRPVQPGVILTESVRTRLIGQGSTPNSFMTYLLHRTVNANGEQTTYFTDYSVECR